MSTYRPTQSDECPSWIELVQALEEGRPLSADHLRDCGRCRERAEFVAALSSAATVGDPAVVLGACPDESDWAALADEGVGRRARMDLVKHLSKCDRCSSLWRHLIEVKGVDKPTWEVRESRSASGAADFAVEVGRPYRRFPRWAGPAFATAATVLVLIVLLSKPFPPVGSGNDARWRGPVSELSAGLSWEVGGDTPVLRWEAFPGATSYRVRLWNGEGEQIIDHQLAAEPSPRYRIELPDVAADQFMLWQVEALEAGRVLASAGPTEFHWRAR